MARLTNTPQQPTLLCLERSKSFSMAVRVYKETPSKQRQALDITGATLQFVMAEPSRLGGSVVIDQALELLSANVGYARLNLQAAALTLPADEEYSFIIRLIEAGGYSRVLIKGEVEVIDNTDDFDSNVYEHSANTQGLSAVLRGDQTVHVFLNGGEGESVFVESQLQVGEQTFAEPDEDPDMSIADGVLAVRWPAPPPTPPPAPPPTPTSGHRMQYMNHPYAVTEDDMAVRLTLYSAPLLESVLVWKNGVLLTDWEWEFDVDEMGNPLLTEIIVPPSSDVVIRLGDNFQLRYDTVDDVVDSIPPPMS